WDDYLRHEAATYRQLAEKPENVFGKQELLDLAAVCEEVANSIEDRLTGGEVVLGKPDQRAHYPRAAHPALRRPATVLTRDPSWPPGILPPPRAAVGGPRHPQPDTKGPASPSGRPGLF